MLSKYTHGNTYLVYKKPSIDIKAMLIFLSRLLGGFSIVSEDKKFKYKNGILIEEDHKYNDKHIYIKTKDINSSILRLYKGRKWSFKNNCFTLLFCFYLN